MYKNIAKGIEAIMKILAFVLAVAVPLAIWKVIEIATWIINNVSITNN